MASLHRYSIALCGALVLAAPPAARAALPAVTTAVTTAPMANLGAHRGITVSAGCGPGSTLVGGGSYLRTAAGAATLPTNGLVLGGTAPSTGASPVDAPAGDGAPDPAHWTTLANFTGVSEAGDQAATFAMCAAGGPAHTIVRTASTTGLNAAQQASPPTPTTATCPPGDRLLGGGAVTRTPDQVNDGTTMGNNGNLKPLGSYPSDAAGTMAPDGSTTADSWSAYAAAGIAAPTDTVTAFALCSTDPTTPPIRVARVDVAGPDAQTGTTLTTVPATCPSPTRLFGGGYAVDETVGAVGGLEPQQGYHVRGSYPSDPGSVEVADGAPNPATWTTLVQAGGQNLPAGDHMDTHGFALCAPAPAPPGDADLSVTATSAPARPVAGQPLTYALRVANAGPAAATAVTLTDLLPAGAAYVSAAPSAGACTPSSGTVSCALGSLAAGASVTATLVVTPAAPGTFEDTATVAAVEPDPNPADDSTTSTATVVAANRAATTLTGAAPPTGRLAGQIADRVTLAGGPAPTGAISFTLYGPDDPTCARALATSTAAVAGDGAYASAPVTADAAGTYRWVAAYGGDAVDQPAGPGSCADPGQATAVTAAPALTAQAGPGAAFGGAISARATLAGGTRMTGTVTFTLYGPGDTACLRPLAHTAAAVSGAGVYASAPVPTVAAGTYRWVATYSGDPLNDPAGPTPCPGAPVTVAAPSDAFHLAAVRSDGRRRIEIALGSPGPGRFTATATTTARGIRVGAAAASVPAAATVHLLITPGASARAELRRHTKVRVRVAIAFTPIGGLAHPRTVLLTLRGTR